jgi:hypothetical protein
MTLAGDFDTLKTATTDLCKQLGKKTRTYNDCECYFYTALLFRDIFLSLSSAGDPSFSRCKLLASHFFPLSCPALPSASF